MLPRMLLSLTLLALVGCTSQPVTAPESQSSAGQITRLLQQSAPCPKEADTAVLLKLTPVLGNTDWTSEESVAAAEKSIACYRPWASTLIDLCQRASMEQWLDYYEGKAREAKERFKSSDHESDVDKTVREYNERVIKAKVWERAHPFPKLPQCESK